MKGIIFPAPRKGVSVSLENQMVVDNSGNNKGGS
jgi:hypothetical protein